MEAFHILLQHRVSWKVLYKIKVFTTPSVPLVGDRNLREEGGNRPTRCSEPLRSKVGGPSKVFAILCGMGPPGDNNLQFIVYSLQLAG